MTMGYKKPDAVPLRGVSFDPKPGGGVAKNPNLVWRVRLYFDGQEMTLGRYATVTEANAALVEHRAVFDAVFVRCDLVGRCEGCKGLRYREEAPH
jgi:hypothetical protein